MIRFFSLLAFPILAACGSGGADGIAEIIEGPSYRELLAGYDAMGRITARYTTEGRTTPNLPGSGVLEYAGVANFSEHASEQILAITTIEVNFSDAALSGRLSNFRHVDGTEFEGFLRLTNGAFSANEDETTSVSFGLDGNLTSNSPAMSTVDVSGGFDGRFVGDNFEFIRGESSTTWVTNEGLSTVETHDMGGRLIVEKQY